MAVDPTILAHGPAVRLAATADVKVGQLVYWNGTRLVASDADADLDAPYWAEYIVVAGRATVDDDTVAVSKYAICEDADLTTQVAEGIYYLSTTAGGITATRPTTAGSLRQIVGRALNDSSSTVPAKYEIDLGGKPFEIPVHGFLLETNCAEGPGIETTAGTPLAIALDSGYYEGYGLDGQNDYVTFGLRVPENAIALAKAVIHAAEEAAPAGTPVYTIGVASAIHDAAHDAVTADTITSQDIIAGDTADDVGDFDMSGAFDAANIVRPGALLAIKILKTDAGTDEAIVFGVTCIFRCV